MEVVWLVVSEEPDAELLAVFPTKIEAEVWVSTKPATMEELFIVPVYWKPTLMNPLQVRDLKRVVLQ